MSARQWPKTLSNKSVDNYEFNEIIYKWKRNSRLNRISFVLDIMWLRHSIKMFFFYNENKTTDAVTGLIRHWLLNRLSGARLSNSDNILFFFFWKILFSTVYPFSDGKGHNVYRCTQPNEAVRLFVTTRLKKNRNSDRLQSHTSLPIFGSNYAARRRAFGSVQTAAIGVILMPSRRPLTFRPSTVTTRTVRSNFPRSKCRKDKFHQRCRPVVYVRGMSACGFHCIFFNYNYFHNPRNGTIKTTIIRPPRSKRTSRVPSSANVSCRPRCV